MFDGAITEVFDGAITEVFDGAITSGARAPREG